MILTEPTPNPNSLKFISEKLISEIGIEEFQKKDISSVKNSFVKELLDIEGIELVLLSDNFITVKKIDNISWEELKPVVISHLNDYFEKNNKPILTMQNDNDKGIEFNQEDSDETVKKIKEILNTKIRPAVARDGGDIKFKSFEEGIVKVELQGSCSGCPSSLMTLKQGVQNLLKHYVKEVNSVEAI